MAEIRTFSIERITLCGFKARSASVSNTCLFVLLSRTSMCFILDTLVPFGELFCNLILLFSFYSIQRIRNSLPLKMN